MTNLVIGFLLGVIVGGGGVMAFMYRDWQECKRISRQMIDRLKQDHEQRARDAEGK